MNTTAAIQRVSRVALRGRSSNTSVSVAAKSSRGLCHCDVSIPKPPGWKPMKDSAATKPVGRPYATVNEEQQNLSFVLQKAKHVSFEDRPVPSLQSPHDVLINVQWTGICGSDVHYWDHGEVGPFKVEKPMVLGHESAGVITQVGNKVTSLKVGDRVAMEPGIPCRRCERCREGRYNLCYDMAFAATPPIDGTLAKYYTLPEDFCYKLPDHVTLEEGAVVEPLSVGVHIVRQGGVKPGDSVIVYGAGPVGLVCMAVAKAFGATKVIAVDINEERLRFATEYCATHGFRSAKESPEASAARLIQENDLGPGADVVIDATGAEPCIQQSVHAVRVGGTYVQGGMGKPEINFPIMTACTKELTIKGSFRYASGDYSIAVELISSGKVDVKRLITQHVKFADAEAAFHEVKAARGIKSLIEGPANISVTSTVSQTVYNRACSVGKTVTGRSTKEHVTEQGRIVT